MRDEFNREAGSNIEDTLAYLERSAFFAAVAEGNAEAVGSMLARSDGTAASWTDEDGLTPLMIAAKHGQVGIMRTLVRNGAAINAENPNGSTALMFAAYGGQTAAAAELLMTGADIDHQNKKGHSALMSAAAQGHEATVALLVKQGASIDQKDLSGMAAQDFATENGHEAISRMIQEAPKPGPVVKDVPESAPVEGEKEGKAAKPKETKKTRRERKVKTETAGQPEKPALTPEQKAFFSALKEENLADVLRIIGTHKDCVQWKDEEGLTAMMLCAKNNQKEAAWLLIRAGADLNAENPRGSTALMYAAHGGHEDVLKLLLAQEGTDVDRQNKAGHTALMFGADEGRDSAAALLLEKGARIEITDAEGKTALDHAVENDAQGVVEQFRIFLEKQVAEAEKALEVRKQTEAEAKRLAEKEKGQREMKTMADRFRKSGLG